MPSVYDVGNLLSVSRSSRPQKSFEQPEPSCNPRPQKLRAAPGTARLQIQQPEEKTIRKWRPAPRQALRRPRESDEPELSTKNGVRYRYISVALLRGREKEAGLVGRSKAWYLPRLRPRKAGDNEPGAMLERVIISRNHVSLTIARCARERPDETGVHIVCHNADLTRSG
jgi:hypothetical protein